PMTRGRPRIPAATTARETTAATDRDELAHSRRAVRIRVRLFDSQGTGILVRNARPSRLEVFTHDPAAGAPGRNFPTDRPRPGQSLDRRCTPCRHIRPQWPGLRPGHRSTRTTRRLRIDRGG